MKKKIFLLTFIVRLLSHCPTSGLSVVYNFRIAQITRKPIAQETEDRPNSFAPLIFDLYQKMHGFDVRENYAGALFTYNRNFAQNYYFRADFAFAHTYQTTNNVTTVNVTELDDILLTAGRNFKPGPKSRATISGLFGIPTHSVKTLQRVGFGVGQFGVGAQLDGKYKFSQPVDFLWGARYNYFIPRTSFDIDCNAYKFTLGNIADVLIALQTSKPLGHGIEGGYDGRWGFGAKACPTIANIGLLDYMRNNFYLVYKYTFLTKRVAHRFLFNISYGFDAYPKSYGYDAVMVWASWGMAF